MWLNPDRFIERLKQYGISNMAEMQGARDSNYERNAFSGDIVRHLVDVRAVFLTMKTLTDVKMKKTPCPSFHVFITKSGKCLITFLYPTHYIESSRELWDIPEDDLNKYGFCIAIEGVAAEIKKAQSKAAVAVCAAVMDLANIDSDRVVSDFEDDQGWIDRIEAKRASGAGSSGADQGSTDTLF